MKPTRGCLLLPVLAVAAAAQVTSAGSAIAELKHLSLDELADIEVTSVSRRQEKLSETASAIQVITGEGIRRSGATSLAEALRLATNLQVAQIDSRQWAISARGFNNSSSNKLLVLMDGRTLYSPLHAAVFWDVQDTLLEDIDRIEVISGPGATQWGANAVNGVINIITKSAKDTPGLLVTGGFGSTLNESGGVRYGGTLAPGLHYRVYAKAFSRDQTRFANGRAGANDWQMAQGGFRVDRDAGSGRQFTLQGDAYAGRIGQPGLDDVRVRGENLLGRWTHTLSPDSRLSVQGYYDHTHRVIPGTFAQDLYLYDLDFQHSFVVGSNQRINWGAGFRLYDDHEHNIYPVLAFLPERVTRPLYSLSAQDEVSVLQDRLHLTAGVKFEHNYFSGWEIQPSVRFAWLPHKTQTVWGAVSRAVRAPSRIDGELVAPRDPPFTLLQPNPDFASEVLLAYELGWRIQPRPGLSLSLASYYNDYDRLRSSELVRPPAPFPFYFGNGQQGTVTGVEITADYLVTSAWQWRAGYTQMRLRLKNKAGSTAVPPTHTDPEHQFFLRSSLDLPGGIQLDASYRLVARLPAARVPAYDELDVRLGWAPSPGWDVSLIGQNLLQARHAEFNPASSRQLIERNVFLRLTWKY